MPILGVESIDKKNGPEPSKDKVKLRRLAGILSMFVGFPNLLIGIALSLSGIALVVLLTIGIIKLLFEEPSDSLCGPIILVIVLILFVFLLIGAVIFTVIASVFAVGVAGQAIGGFLGFKGRRYTWTFVLTLVGSIVSMVAGIGVIIFGLLLKAPPIGLKVGLLLFGAYDIIASLGTWTSFILFIATKETFRKPEKKKKKKKGNQGEETGSDTKEESSEEKEGEKIPKPVGWDAKEKDEE